MKRKVCVVVASRANYGRVKYVLKAIQAHPDLELQLVVGASVLLDRFGNALRVIEKDGFTPTRKIYYVIEEDTIYIVRILHMLVDSKAWLYRTFGL